MSVQAWFPEDGETVQPGNSVTLSLSLENPGPQTETYTILPAGSAAGWVTVERASATIFAGSVDVLEVTVKPPRIHSTLAGPTTVAVRVISQSDPDDQVVVETTCEIEPYNDRRITLFQPVVRSRRRAEYEFLVENHGNMLANCRLHLVDPSDRIDGEFDPPAVGVVPGQSSLVRLNAHIKGGRFRRFERQIDFEIEATEPDYEPAIGRATLVQPSTISRRGLTRAAPALTAVVAVVVAWFAVARPQIDEAIDDAVSERLNGPAPAATATATETSVLSDPDDTAKDSASPTVVASSTRVGPIEPWSDRLSVSAGVTDQRNQSLLVPPDRDLLVTDIVLQNPNLDDGTALLTIDEEVVYQWDLGTMSNVNEFQPRVSPIPVGAGQQIELQVSCDNVGSATATTCETGVLLGGSLVERS